MNFIAREKYAEREGKATAVIIFFGKQVVDLTIKNY